jgi:hypothetical protein
MYGMEWLLQLKKAIENGKESVSFKADTTDKKFIDKINNALSILPLNSGYNGFLINDFMLNYSSDGSVDLKIKYFQAPPQTKAVEEFAVKFVATSIKSTMTDLEKLIVVHDYVINSVKYDYTFKNRSPYSAIKEKKSVCSGFALLAGKLLEIAKVKQFYVTGDSSDPTTHKMGKHIWNKINLNGLYYNIDFTWDSCCKESNPYIYFCVTDSQISSSHKPNKQQAEIPKSTDQIFFKTLSSNKLSDLEKRILTYVSPGIVYTQPKELSEKIKKPGLYTFSIPMGTNIETFLSNALKPHSSTISRYESQALENNVLKVLQVKLIIHGR